MVTRNDESVTCHLLGLDQRNRRASARGQCDENAERLSPRNAGTEFGISCAHNAVTPRSVELHGMATASQEQVARAANGQFRPGVSGNAAGNVHRSRHALNADTIREMHAAFRQGGREAIDKVMRTQPAVFLKLLVLLVPREMKLEHSGGVKAMSDEQLERSIELLQAAIARREAGENAKVVEGVAEPAALPAPRKPRRKTRKSDTRTARPRRVEEDVVS
jgi:hypothetical protein